MQDKEVFTTTESSPANGFAELGAVAAAAAIRNGDISSESYATALLQRARQECHLNAFITIDETAVLAAARDADKARAAGVTSLSLVYRWH